MDSRVYSNCHVGYILSLGVCSSLRRQGVASLLLDSFLTHVTQTENQICKAIYLHVLTMNSAAIRFYEKHYFRYIEIKYSYLCIKQLKINIFAPLQAPFFFTLLLFSGWKVQGWIHLRPLHQWRASSLGTTISFS